MKKFRNIIRLFFIVFFILSGAGSLGAASESYGYQLALIDARAQNPQQVLLNKKITPTSANVREFEWILETLRNRCRNSQEATIRTLVEMWRITQRRGYNVTLLEFSRQAGDFSNVAFKAMRNQKMDFDKITLKLLKDKFPVKH
jgi:hypothetical protein